MVLRAGFPICWYLIIIIDIHNPGSWWLGLWDLSHFISLLVRLLYVQRAIQRMTSTWPRRIQWDYFSPVWCVTLVFFVNRPNLLIKCLNSNWMNFFVQYSVTRSTMIANSASKWNPAEPMYGWFYDKRF